MADNSIDHVREAELEAEETAHKADRDAAQIVDDAQQKAVKMVIDAEDEARARAAEKVAAAHAVSQQQLEAARDNLSGEMDELTAKARSHQEEAVKEILKALA